MYNTYFTCFRFILLVKSSKYKKCVRSCEHKMLYNNWSDDNSVNYLQ